jgi:hypothetical protein
VIASPAVSAALHLLVPIAAGMVATAVVAFFAARRYGLNSKRKRDMIFSLVSLAGLALLAAYVFVRMP